MSPLPNPPEGTRLTWRPWSPSDAEALARHALRVHEAERLDHVGGPGMFHWLAAQAGFDPELDSLVGLDTDGEVRADVGAWGFVTDQGSRVSFWLDADPGFTYLRPFLIDWAEARARQRLGPGNSTDRVIRMSVEEHRRSLRSALEDAGFTAARRFALLRRNLSDLPMPDPLPVGVEVEPWSIERDEATRLANNESFADHWGSFPMDVELWHSVFRDSNMFRPDLSFLATVADEVVCFCLAEIDEQDGGDDGTTEVYVRKVGTRRAYRRRGIASHLVLRTMEAALEAGLERVALDVDDTSDTGADGLYRRLGFEKAERSVQYVKHA